MLLSNLVKRANITTKDANNLLQTWSSGYKVTSMRTQQFIEASESPMDLNARKERYLIEQNSDLAHQAPAESAPQAPRAVSRATKIVKKSKEPKIRMSMDDILQRVLKKQAESASAAENSKRIRHEFLGAQVPVVEGVLRSLGGLTRNFSLNEIVRKVQASSKSALGAQEVLEVLKRIDFVKVIDAGGIKCVELEAPIVAVKQIAVEAS